MHTQSPKESNLKNYVTTKYVKYLDKFEHQFKTSLPTAHRLYRLFKDGTWELFADTKEYYSVFTQVKAGAPLSSFSCKQLHLYQQLPGDLLKSAPLIVAIALPFVQYLILPLAYYMYPKLLLCRYFWSDEQLKKFSAQDLESRYSHYPKVINYLITHSKEVKDDKMKNQLLLFTEQLMKQDTNIDPHEILVFKPLFKDLPFKLEHLNKRHKIHKWHLCKGMEVKGTAEELDLLRQVDLALMREGVDNIDKNILKQIGLKRGVNSYEITDAQLKQYLNKWLQVSTALDAQHNSLLLHTPVLLNSQAYT